MHQNRNLSNFKEGQNESGPNFAEKYICNQYKWKRKKRKSLVMIDIFN